MRFSFIGAGGWETTTRALADDIVTRNPKREGI